MNEVSNIKTQLSSQSNPFSQGNYQQQTSSIKRKDSQKQHVTNEENKQSFNNTDKDDKKNKQIRDDQKIDKNNSTMSIRDKVIEAFCQKIQVRSLQKTGLNFFQLEDPLAMRNAINLNLIEDFLLKDTTQIQIESKMLSQIWGLSLQTFMKESKMDKFEGNFEIKLDYARKTNDLQINVDNFYQSMSYFKKLDGNDICKYGVKYICKSVSGDGKSTKLSKEILISMMSDIIKKVKNANCDDKFHIVDMLEALDGDKSQIRQNSGKIKYSFEADTQQLTILDFTRLLYFIQADQGRQKLLIGFNWLIPDINFTIISVPKTTIISTPLSRLLLGRQSEEDKKTVQSNLINDGSRVYSGFISIDQDKRVYPLMPNDQEVFSSSIVGLWFFGVQEYIQGVKKDPINPLKLQEITSQQKSNRKPIQSAKERSNQSNSPSKLIIQKQDIKAPQQFVTLNYQEQDQFEVPMPQQFNMLPISKDQIKSRKSTDINQQNQQVIQKSTQNNNQSSQNLNRSRNSLIAPLTIDNLKNILGNDDMRNSKELQIQEIMKHSSNTSRSRSIKNQLQHYNQQRANQQQETSQNANQYQSAAYSTQQNYPVIENYQTNDMNQNLLISQPTAEFPLNMMQNGIMQIDEEEKYSNSRSQKRSNNTSMIDDQEIPIPDRSILGEKRSRNQRKNKQQVNEIQRQNTQQHFNNQNILQNFQDIASSQTISELSNQKSGSNSKLKRSQSSVMSGTLGNELNSIKTNLKNQYEDQFAANRPKGSRNVLNNVNKQVNKDQRSNSSSSEDLKRDQSQESSKSSQSSSDEEKGVDHTYNPYSFKKIEQAIFKRKPLVDRLKTSGPSQQILKNPKILNTANQTNLPTQIKNESPPLSQKYKAEEKNEYDQQIQTKVIPQFLNQIQETQQLQVQEEAPFQFQYSRKISPVKLQSPKISYTQDTKPLEEQNLYQIPYQPEKFAVNQSNQEQAKQQIKQVIQKNVKQVSDSEDEEDEEKSKIILKMRGDRQGKTDWTMDLPKIQYGADDEDDDEEDDDAISHNSKTIHDDDDDEEDINVDLKPSINKKKSKIQVQSDNEDSEDSSSNCSDI
eukprot:403350483